MPRKRPMPVRNTLIALGILLLVLLAWWGVAAARPRPPVPFDPVTADALNLDDGSWDHFEVVAVPRDTSRDDLQRLLDWLRERYAASEYNRVRVVILNDKYALLNANDRAVVAEYRQDRGKSEFLREIK
ncbi:MAG TPA: hypothetical protein VEI97_14390 [bacterium]|nr:hypothetical protein [bacterium]